MKLFFVLALLLTLLQLAYFQCPYSYQYQDSSTGLCLPCSYNCMNCYDSTYCLTCINQYYLTSNNTCSACLFGCSICTDSISCTSCNDGLYLTNDGTCSVCSTGVATCTIALIQTCQDGYFLLSSICAGCFSNCKTCSDFVTCNQCSLTYYLSASSSSCLSCPSNCLICTNSSSCSQCQQGYTQTATGCALYNCSSIDPYCIACTSNTCLTCKQGKYLQNGICNQGASLLCLEASGPYNINCQTSNYGCASYSVVQSALPSVCLPKSATQLQQFVFISNANYDCSGSCNQPLIFTFSYSTSQAYYQIDYYFNVRFYLGNSIRNFSVSITDINGSSLISSNKTMNLSAQFTNFNEADPNCGNCVFAQQIVAGTFSLSGGEYSTNISLSDTTGLFVVVQTMLQHHICQVSHCSHCTSAVDCYACFSPYYLQLTTCVSSCDAGFYLYGRVCELQCPSGTYTVSSTYTCQTCASPCLTCSDSATCLTCLTGYFLDGSSCLTSCTSTYLFANITSNACQSCPNPCVTCLAINTTVICLSCAQGYLFNGSSCIFVCPWGYFGNFINETSQCSTCQSSCTQCYINSSICQSCASGYLLLESTCEALASCPSSYYINYTYNQCISCHYPCSSCSYTANNCTSCIKGSLYNSQCVNQCPEYHYQDYSNSQNITCRSCTSPCSSCVSVTSCTSCISNYYLHQTSCLSACPIYYYNSNSNNSCIACNPPCKICSNATACLSCSTGYLDNTTCTLTCNSTSYISSSFQCTLCPSPCISCYSPSYCLSCSLPYLLYNNSCITSILCTNKTGYYVSYSPNSANATSAVCSACTYPCASCVNTSVTCISCPNGYLYVPDMYKCDSSCPTSYYVSASNCFLCNQNCYQCSIISTNCTACSSGMYLFKGNNTCLSSCPNQYYADDSTQSCAACVSPCLSCYNAYLCSSCLINIFYSKQCVSSCPSSTYLNTTTNSCMMCTNNCLTCSGSSSSCLSCASGSYLYNSSCLSTCPNLQYGNQYTRTCLSCSSPCANCSSDSACLSCLSGYYYYNFECVTACASSYYADNSTNSCLSCNLTICLTCVANANNCLTCNTNYYYYLNTCQSQCPNQTYANPATATCTNCPFPCNTCKNSTYCFNCLPNYYLFQNHCFSQCPIGYYAANSSACYLCATTCQVCTSSACLECNSGYFILNNTCLSSCPLGYYPGVQAITNYDTCLSCQTDCLNCSSYDYCIQCISTLIQFNGLCLSSCPILYYAINQTNSYYCNKCSQYCTNCVNNTYCLTCIGSYLYQNQCTVTCPATTYAYQGVSCQPCKSPCLDCTGDFTCINCIAGYIYFHQYCVVSCPIGIWYYPSNNSCSVQCPYNKYEANMTCYIGPCSPTMVTLNNYCLSECSAGYYVSPSQQCILCSTNPSLCDNLFVADLEILQVEELSLSLYFNQKSQLANINHISIQIVDIEGKIIQDNYTSYQITQYSITLNFDYRTIQLVNLTLTIPYVLSQQTSQCISVNYFKVQLPLYMDYSDYQKTSFIAYLALIIIAILFIVIAINICNKSSHFSQILDFAQLVAVTLYLNIQYPPILQYFLSGFRLILFSLSKNMINIAPYRFSAPKFIYYHTDSSLFRNQLIPLIAFLVIFISFIIIIAIHTYDQTKFESPVKVIRYRLINDLFSLFMTPLYLFASQVSHAKTLDLVFTVLLGLIGVGYVIWIGYKIVQIKKIQELAGLLGDFQRTSSKLGLMYAPFAFARRIVFTFSLGISPFSPISTLTLLLVLTFLIMICVYFYQPFDNQYTDYVTIFMQLSLTIYIICLIVLALNIFSASNSNNLAIFIVSLIVLTVVIALAWLIYLTVEDIKSKGCCPKAKEQTVDLQNAKDDYSQTKSQKNRKMDAERDRLQKQAKQGKKNNKQIQQQESAHQFIQRYNGKSDELYSKTNENEQFKHWSEQTSQKQQPSSKKQVVLPHLLLKKDLTKKQD